MTSDWIRSRDYTHNITQLHNCHTQAKQTSRKHERNLSRCLNLDGYMQGVWFTKQTGMHLERSDTMIVFLDCLPQGVWLLPHQPQRFAEPKHTGNDHERSDTECSNLDVFVQGVWLTKQTGMETDRSDTEWMNLDWAPLGVWNKYHKPFTTNIHIGRSHGKNIYPSFDMYTQQGDISLMNMVPALVKSTTIGSPLNITISIQGIQSSRKHMSYSIANQARVLDSPSITSKSFSTPL